MQSKAPARSPSLQPEERKQQLETFVEAAIKDQHDRPDCVLVVARSPESPVARAVFQLSDTLARQRLGGRIVFACSQAMSAGDVWQLTFDRGFLHETRLAPDPRVLGAHEQLIVGDAAVWYGDCMRRDPAKRDAFQSFASDADAAVIARRMFARLWQSATPLYGHDAAGTLPSPALAEAQPRSDPGADLVPADVLATLVGWQPATKH